MYVEERAGFDVDTDPYEGMFGQMVSISPGGGISTRNGGGGGGGHVGDSGGGYLDPFYGLDLGSNPNPFTDPSRQVEVEVEAEAEAEGGGGLDQIGDLLAQAGVSALSLGISLGGCGGDADCAWNALKSIIVGHPQASMILETILTTDCRSALTALGLPSTVVTAACLLGGDVWSGIQAKAAGELGVEVGTTSPSRQQQYEESYARGRDRSDAEGGGHTLVDADGREIGVWCPGYVHNIARDAAGNIVVYVVEIPKDYDAGTRCPQDAPGTVRREGVIPVAVPSGSRTFVAKPREVSLYTIPPGTITGRVTDASGAPILGAQIRVGSLVNNPAATTDANGAFSVRAPATSRNFLYVSAVGYDTQQADGAAVSGATRDAGTIVLAAAAGSNVAKSGTRWYSNKWLWIGTGVVVVGGVAAYAISRRRSR